MAAAQKLDDPLNMTVRALLERLVANQQVETDWVNVRSELWPWRQLVAAAERGEVQLARVGRKLLVKREELDGWIAKHYVKSRRAGDLEPPQTDEDAHVMRLIERAGHRRKR